MKLGWKLAVAAIGMLFALLGVRWMFSPAAIATEQGMQLTNAVGFNTARGDIGGLFVAGALLCAIAIPSRDRRWLDAMSLLVACVALGRIVGIASDGFAPTSGGALGIEIAMLIGLRGAARSLSSANR
jgi:hypothetical protein